MYKMMHLGTTVSFLSHVLYQWFQWSVSVDIFSMPGSLVLCLFFILQFVSKLNTVFDRHGVGRRARGGVLF